MSKYIMNVKNILKIIILVFVVINCIKSCSKAYDNDVTRAIDSNMTILHNKGFFSDLWWGTWENTGKTNLFNDYYFSDVRSYSILITSSNSSIQSNSIIFITNSSTDRIYNAGQSWFNIDCHMFVASLNNTWNGRYNGTTPGGQYWNNATFEYGYTTFNIQTNSLWLSAGQEYGGNYINAKFEFVPNGEQVTYQDYIDKPYAILHSYSNSLWKLGEIKDYEGAYKVEARFTSLAEETTKGTITFLTEQEYTKNNNMIVDDNFVYVQSRDLYYNQVYYLIFYLYDENDFLLDSSGYNILFLPLNAKVEGGEIIDSGSGDFTIQDSTNAIIDNQVSKDDLTTIIGIAPSGDQPRYWFNWFYCWYTSIRR